MNRSLLPALAVALGSAAFSPTADADEPRRIVKPTVTVEVIDDARHVEDIISKLRRAAEPPRTVDPARPRETSRRETPNVPPSPAAVAAPPDRARDGTRPEVTRPDDRRTDSARIEAQRAEATRAEAQRAEATRRDSRALERPALPGGPVIERAVDRRGTRDPRSTGARATGRHK